MCSRKRSFENSRIKTIPIVMWIIVICIVLSLIGNLIRGVRYSNNDIVYTISKTEFYKNKQHFETISDTAYDLFSKEYENNNELICIRIYSTSVGYYFKDSTQNKTVDINFNEDIVESFDALYDLFRTGETYGGLQCVIANKDQVIFAGNQRRASIVHNNSVFKPRSIITPYGENEIISFRLGFKWFQCAEKVN